jgi:hypothetical protein
VFNFFFIVAAKVVYFNYIQPFLPIIFIGIVKITRFTTVICPLYLPFHEPAKP